MVAVFILDAAKAICSKEWTPARGCSTYLPVKLFESGWLIDDDELGHERAKFCGRKHLVFFIGVLVEGYIPISTARVLATRSNLGLRDIIPLG